MSRVAFIDLVTANALATNNVENALLRVARSGVYLRGPELERFEKVWAETCGARGAVAVSSGTDALRLSLLASGIQPHDQVIVPAFGSPYTAIAVRLAGAVPVFADIDVDSWTLSADSANEVIGPRTKAIIAVHLYGRRADLTALGALAERHGLMLIEDAAQAHGLPGSSQSRARAYSFYPTKNLGALGDAGCVVSDDESLLEKARALREGGDAIALRARTLSGVARMDELQAAVLLAKLPHLVDWNARRRAIAEHYLSALDGAPRIRLPARAPADEHVWHLFVIEHPERAKLVVGLNDANVDARVHYPFALHQQPLFAGSSAPRPLPNAERAAAHVLSLPLHPGLRDEQVDRVIGAVLRYARRSG